MTWSPAIRGFAIHPKTIEKIIAGRERFELAAKAIMKNKASKTPPDNDSKALTISQTSPAKTVFFPQWFQEEVLAEERRIRKDEIHNWVMKVLDPLGQVKKILLTLGNECSIEDVEFIQRKYSPKELIQVLGSLSSNCRKIALEKLKYIDSRGAYIKTSEGIEFFTQEQLKTWTGTPQHN